MERVPNQAKLGTWPIMGTKIILLPALLNPQLSSFQCSNVFIHTVGSLIYLKNDVICCFFFTVTCLLCLICTSLDPTFLPTISTELSSPPGKTIKGPVVSDAMAWLSSPAVQLRQLS